jgi:hypothetical protein
MRRDSAGCVGQCRMCSCGRWERKARSVRSVGKLTCCESCRNVLQLAAAMHRSVDVVKKSKTHASSSLVSTSRSCGASCPLPEAKPCPSCAAAATRLERRRDAMAPASGAKNTLVCVSASCYSTKRSITASKITTGSKELVWSATSGMARGHPQPSPPPSRLPARPRLTCCRLFLHGRQFAKDSAE